MLLAALRQFYQEYLLGRTVWVAYSGGLDSHVLLALCMQLRAISPISLKAIHVNHQISCQADAWASHCQAICDEHAIDYIQQSILEISGRKGSIEQIARDQRYAIFAKYIKKRDILLTAHHQNDQAETVLLQLLRGAGPAGLAAMPSIKHFSKGWHARPLLAFSREQLTQYAKQQKLHWVEDESNTDTRYTRNFIRHQLLPLLKKRWPSVTTMIARSSTHCAETQAYLTMYLSQALKQVTGSHPGCLSVSALLKYSPYEQRLILRAWIKEEGYSVPNTKKMHSIQQTVLVAARDRMPCVCWAQVMIRRYQNNLYLLPLETNEMGQPSWVAVWKLNQSLLLPGGKILYTQNQIGKGLLPTIKQVMVCFRQGGEVMHRPNRHKVKLKKMLQEWQVPPWRRNQIPLIIMNNQFIGVVGYFMHPDYCVQALEIGQCIYLSEPL